MVSPTLPQYSRPTRHMVSRGVAWFQHPYVIHAVRSLAHPVRQTSDPQDALISGVELIVRKLP
jgi:hypothetical protein